MNRRKLLKRVGQVLAGGIALTTKAEPKGLTFKCKDELEKAERPSCCEFTEECSCLGQVPENDCEHLRKLYPSMNLQLKMARCGHFLIHGYWECLDCNEWIFIECEDEWDGREGVKSKDGKYQYQRIDGINKIIKL